MSLEIDAVYENGVFKLDHPLPLAEHQRVRLVVEQTESIAQRSYGIIGWQGDPQVVREVAIAPECGPIESP